MSPADAYGSFSGGQNVTRHQVRVLHWLITQQRLSVCLEVTHSNAASTQIIARAIEEIGNGSLVSIALDVESSRQREAATSAPIGLSQFVTRYQDQQSAHEFLINCLYADPPERFDFCFLSCGSNWRETFFFLSMLTRLLKPGAWLAISDVVLGNANAEYPLEEFPDPAKGKNSFVEKRGIFEGLVQRDPLFCNFRRIGQLRFGQKRGAPGTEHDQTLDIAVSLAMERAYRDPDFRNSLLCEPAATLRLLTGVNTSAFERVSFRESTSKIVAFDYQVVGQSRVYCLERPKWSTLAPESYYLNLLTEP